MLLPVQGTPTDLSPKRASVAASDEVTSGDFADSMRTAAQQDAQIDAATQGSDKEAGAAATPEESKRDAASQGPPAVRDLPRHAKPKVSGEHAESAETAHAKRKKSNVVGPSSVANDAVTGKDASDRSGGAALISTSTSNLGATHVQVPFTQTLPQAAADERQSTFATGSTPSAQVVDATMTAQVELQPGVAAKAFAIDLPVAAPAGSTSFLKTHEEAVFPASAWRQEPAKVSGPATTSSKELTSTRPSSTSSSSEWSVQSYEAQTPNRLEIGVAGGSYGWLKVRAELSSSGEVHAFLRGASERVDGDLRAQAAELQSYLGTQQVSVSRIYVEAPQLDLTYASSMTGQQQQGSAEQERNGSQQATHTLKQPRVEGALAIGIVPVALLPRTAAGSWLSVMA